MVMLYLPILQRHTVGNAHQSADRDYLIAFQQRPHRVFQRIPLKQGIRVHTDKIRETGSVNPHVQRISLTAVFLDDQGYANPMNLAFINCFLLLTRHLKKDRDVYKRQEYDA